MRLLLLLLVSLTLAGQGTDPTRFAGEIAAFERADSLQPVEPGVALFVGSSSVRFWESLAEDFPGYRVLNRGFGGSAFSDLLYYADRIVYPYRPGVVFVYEGDNDIAAGDSPRSVLRQAKQFRKELAEQLGPEVPVVFISPKPSVARWQLRERYEEANERLEHYANRTPHTYFADVWTPALTSDGEVRDDIFIGDNLHMNARGYAIWREVISPFLDRLVR